jgi:hypothetical protein
MIIIYILHSNHNMIIFNIQLTVVKVNNKQSMFLQ